MTTLESTTWRYLLKEESVSGTEAELPKGGGRESAQSVQRLLCKLQDLGLIPRTRV